MKISEAAELLKVSKKTIYRKIDILSLTSKGHVKAIDNVKSIDIAGVEKIRLTLVKGHDKGNNSKNVTVDIVTKLEDHAINSYKQLLEEQKEFFKKMLDEKDLIIDDLRKDKNKLMAMNENHQVLLAREQEKNLLLDKPVVRKGIFKGLFKRRVDD